MSVYLGNIEIQNETYLGNINIPENNINVVPPADIVRGGLLYAYDWTSFQSGSISGSMIDRSSNARIGTWYNVETSSNHLQLNGSSSYIDLNPNSSSLLPWDFTAQWWGSILPSGSYNGTTYPLTTMFLGGSSWSWVQDISGSITSIKFLRATFVNVATNPITGSFISQSFAFTGTTANPPVGPFTGSIIREWYNNQLLPVSGSHNNPTQTFNNAPYAQQFGKGYSGFSVSNFLSGSAKYIVAYNRPLTQTEIQQNNTFFTLGEPIPENQ
jgi:hypothetical protein